MVVLGIKLVFLEIAVVERILYSGGNCGNLGYVNRNLTIPIAICNHLLLQYKFSCLSMV